MEDRSINEEQRGEGSVEISMMIATFCWAGRTGLCMPCQSLNVGSTTWYSIRYRTGSQCNVVLYGRRNWRIQQVTRLLVSPQ